MNVIDLFSGIGGFSLGLERAGMRTVAFCEIEPYCRAVLKKHWPGADDNNWGPDHAYCGNRESVHYTYLTPDADTCENWAGITARHSEIKP